MAEARGHVGKTVIEHFFKGDFGELKSKDPTVLSCGGIYIPHRGTQQRLLYHIINTPSDREPVKVVCGSRPKNVLHEVMLKESMN